MPIVVATTIKLLMAHTMGVELMVSMWAPTQHSVGSSVAAMAGAGAPHELNASCSRRAM